MRYTTHNWTPYVHQLSPEPHALALFWQNYTESSALQTKTTYMHRTLLKYTTFQKPRRLSILAFRRLLSLPETKLNDNDLAGFADKIKNDGYFNNKITLVECPELLVEKIKIYIWLLKEASFKMLSSCCRRSCCSFRGLDKHRCHPHYSNLERDITYWIIN